MATYDSPTGELTVGEPQTAVLSKIETRFCKECANLLYPREDRVTAALYYQCNNCQAAEYTPPQCVHRNELAKYVGETSGVTQDVASDPTLPHVTRDCPSSKCDGTDAVFFQSQQKTAETGMRLFYVCCTCGHVWSPIKER